MEQPEFVRPRIQVLTPAQIEQVHHHSLRILSSVGVRVDSERARRLFALAGGSALAEDRRVRIEPDLVEWALSRAPSTVEVFDRHGSPAFRLGDGHTRFGIGMTNLYYQDPETDVLLPFARSHMRTAVRLGEALPRYDMVSTVGIIQDFPPTVADLYAVLEMVANTRKPLVVLISETGLFPAALDLVEHLCGDVGSRPFLMVYVNPITPLVIDAGTADKMFLAAERRLPLVYSNLGSAGSTAPITPAGMLVLLNAELLAGLALSQLIREGTQIVLGMLPYFFDMKTMDNFLHPKSFLLNLACAEMMAHYRLPHCGTSGSGIGWGPDLMAASGLWMNQLTACLGKAGMAPAIGSNLSSLAFSPCSAVYGHEVITHARQFAEGFPLDDRWVGVDGIAQVGPGGHFLTSDLTLELFRQTDYRSEAFPRLSLDRWQAQGCPQAADRLRDYTQGLLGRLTAPDDGAQLLARGEAWIARHGEG